MPKGINLILFHLIDFYSIFLFSKRELLVDVRIYHPRTQYVNGRPNWLIIEGREWVNLSTKEIKIGFPCLAKAYYSDEPNYAVPTDVMVINDKNEQKAFALKKGNYRVLINNEKGETQTLTLDVK